MAFTCRLPASLDQELTRVAGEKRISKQILIEKVLKEWLEREAIWAQRQRRKP